MFNKIMLLAAVVLLAGCVSSPTVTPTPSATAVISVSATPSGESNIAVAAGDSVSVEYLGKLENGSVFDTNIKAEAIKAGLPNRTIYPFLEFAVGAGQMIPGFDKGVVGMKVGDKKTITLLPADAYGEVLPENIIQVPVANITAEGGARIGMRLFAPSGVSGVITEINGPNATVDFNHALAGKTLVFDIYLKDIRRP
ncbi:MAG: peptidylprolyl isomerase [Candidatus Micrarchaeota archaeon]